MCETAALSVSRARVPALPAASSRRSLRPTDVIRTVRALAPTGRVATSVCSSRLRSFGGSSATPWEAIVRRKSTCSPPAPRRGRSATRVMCYGVSAVDRCGVTLAEHRRCGLSDLLTRDIAHVLREAPPVAEGVGDLTVALAPEGVLAWLPDLRAGVDRPFP